MTDNSIPANVMAACTEHHKGVSEWAAKEFYDGWVAAMKDNGTRWRHFWFQWNDDGSIFADGYLAGADFLDEIDEPDEYLEDLAEGRFEEGPDEMLDA